MRLTKEQFQKWPNKAITLLGMSGVGKTYLSNKLPNDSWFHYSGDYRIGTRYLSEPILDNIKMQAMQVPFLRDLLRSDSIYIENNITVNHLKPVSTFVGKLGMPAKGGLTLKEFKRRQRLYYDAEVSAMLDVPDFICKAKKIYGISNFINDAGGSVCELDNDEVLQVLNENTLIIYIKATEDDEEQLIKRAISSPKPLYYRECFLDEKLSVYMQERSLDYAALIDPDDFVKWVFKNLFYSRIPRYQILADQYGYTITTAELRNVEGESDFLKLIGTKLVGEKDI